MAINTQQFKGEFTQAIIDVYKERTPVKTFGRSFFPEKTSGTKYVSIEVTRGKEKIAVDVLRKTEGNRNTFSLSNQKIFEPPFYREYFDLTELDLYDRAIGSTDSALVADALMDASEKLGECQDLIDRSYEKQCWDVMETGIVSVNVGTNIDFKRKAASLVDGSATPWDGAFDPYSHLELGANFMRQVGKAQGGTFDVVLGSSALNAFLTNATVLSRADIRNFSIDAVNAPQRNAVGATLHGMVSAGAYSFRLWSYPEFYDSALDVSTPYVNPKKIIMLPENPRFVLSHAAVPALINAAPTRGAYVIGEYMDERNTSHIMDIKSAGLAIPVAVDQIYTRQVLA